MEYNSLMKNIESIELEDLYYVEKDLSFNELASLALLLYGEERPTAEFALQKLLIMSNMENTNSSDLLSNYARSVNKENWRTYVIEALAIINARRVLRKLGLKWEFISSYYLPHVAALQINIHPLLKSFYKICENLKIAQAGRLIYYVNENYRPPQDHFRFYNPEILEIFLLDWITRRIVCVGDRAGTNFCIEILLQYAKENDLDEIKTMLIDAIELNVTQSNAEASSSNNISIKMPTQQIEKLSFDESPPKQTNQVTNDINTSQKINLSDCYKINYETAGIALIINQENFDNIETDPELKELLPEKLKSRKGSNVDKVKLEEAFKSYGYKTIVRDNLTHTQMLYEIEETAKRSICYDSFIVCILSHGFDGAVYGTNSVPVWISDIEQKLTSEFLENKPKILIIQACQTKNTKINGKQTERKNIEPNKYRHILKAIATVPGFPSVRDTKQGTWFIQELCKAIKEYGDKKAFYDILTTVNRHVSNKRGTKSNEVMLPQFTSTLTHQFYLPQRKTTN